MKSVIHKFVPASFAIAMAIASPRAAHAQTCGSDTGVTACNNAKVSSASGYADWGNNTGGGTGVGGESTSAGGTGVWGKGGDYGVYGTTAESYATAVYGYASGSGSTGVYGSGESYGVLGQSTTSGYGVYGTSSSGYGVYATSTSADGLHATISNGNSAVAGINNYTSGNAIYGQATGGGWSGNFDGSMLLESGSNFCYASSNPYTCAGGTCIGGACASDERLKKNIQSLTGALDKVLSLRGVTYEWKTVDLGVGVQTGFIAQEVEKVFPKWVGEKPDGMKAIVLPPLELAAIEVESIRELKVENDALRTRTTKLEQRLEALQNGRDPVTGGMGFGKGILLVFGLACGSILGGMFVRRNRAGQAS